MNFLDDKESAVSFEMLKKSVVEIKKEIISEEDRGKIQVKIERLLGLGVLQQAVVLENKLKLRQKLNALSEWDYKILPAEAIDNFRWLNRMITRLNRMITLRDAVEIHIDPLDEYCKGSETMPDTVLDELEKAQERKLFDGFRILWAEKVKDPLLLGIVDGCKDYFLICEWSDDISFDEIMKGKGL